MGRVESAVQVQETWDETSDKSFNPDCTVFLEQDAFTVLFFNDASPKQSI